FVTATEALRQYWSDDQLQRSTAEKGDRVETVLTELTEHCPGSTAKGRGLARGLGMANPEYAEKIAKAAFDRHMLVETSGPNDEVIKVMPPLTVTTEELEQGLDILRDSVADVLG